MTQGTKSKSTHRPFYYLRSTDGCDDVWNIYAEGGEHPIIGIPFWGDDAAWTARSEAIARLFAAAPEMLEALRSAESLLSLVGGKMYIESYAGKSIRAAIEKATISEPAENFPFMPDRVTDAITHVLNHFQENEQRDFEAADEPTQKRHIFHELKVLEVWVRHIVRARGF